MHRSPVEELLGGVAIGLAGVQCEGDQGAIGGAEKLADVGDLRGGGEAAAQGEEALNYNQNHSEQ